MVIPSSFYIHVILARFPRKNLFFTYCTVFVYAVCTHQYRHTSSYFILRIHALLIIFLLRICILHHTHFIIRTCILRQIFYCIYAYFIKLHTSYMHTSSFSILRTCKLHDIFTPFMHTSSYISYSEHAYFIIFHTSYMHSSS